MSYELALKLSSTVEFREKLLKAVQYGCKARE
jgi:hypothetical protein